MDVLSNIVLFEYDETPDELTSAMKMVWLTLLLNMELDELNGGLQRDTAVEIARIAMVPVVMHAAAGLHGSPCDSTELGRLMTEWNVKADAETQQTLLKWWDVYSSRRPAWQTAMIGLNQLLNSNANQGVT